MCCLLLFLVLKIVFLCCAVPYPGFYISLYRVFQVFNRVIRGKSAGYMNFLLTNSIEFV